MGYWFILWGFVSGSVGSSLGINFLFLDPEYLDKVNFLSFFVIGMAWGWFIIAYHITCYILFAYRYKFLASQQNPFIKFCENNSLIPLTFTIYYILKWVLFQSKIESHSVGELFMLIAGFLGGLIGIILLSVLYFQATNLNLFKHLAENVDKKVRKNPLQRANLMEKLNKIKKEKVVITSFYRFPFYFISVSNDVPAEKEYIMKVFDQNQFNTIIFQLVALLLILFLGLFREIPLMQIPAAASTLFLFSILLLFTGGVYYWLKDWALSIFLFTVIIISVLTSYLPHKSYHQAFGMSYETKAVYNQHRISMLPNANNIWKDLKATQAILNNWKQKQQVEADKPKMIIVSMSGGGQRAAAWTMRALQAIDSNLNGTLLDKTVLMTGSSGGLIGGAYYRELFYRKKQGHLISLDDRKYFENLSKDKLNPMIFSLITGDLFFRFQKFKLGEHTYFKDRGFALEQKLLNDTDNALTHSLAYYSQPEKKAEIPLIVIAPTIVNDSRRLFISSQGVSYLCRGLSTSSGRKQIRGIEFRRFFENQEADSIRFLTALRMNATFPYVTPNVLLPSDPPMEVVDAGLSDNFGVNDALQFIHVFKDWINENTSGVILLSIRDSKRGNRIKPHEYRPLVESIVTPLTHVIGNLTLLQDIENDYDIEYA
ncbi:MAG: patatin-like phospholipase family protein, partial [Bacteroidota bacterium]